MEKERTEEEKLKNVHQMLIAAMILVILLDIGLYTDLFSFKITHSITDIIVFAISLSLMMYLSFRLSKAHKALVARIKQQKDAENELKKTTEVLERYFNYALDLFCIADENGHFIKLNRQWESALGYSLEELYNIKFYELIHPDDLNATKDVVAKLNKGEEVLNFVNRYKTKSGVYRFIEWRSIQSANLIIAAARDITERKSYETILLERDTLLKNLSQQLPGFLYQYKMTPDGKSFFPFASENIRKLYGVSPEEAAADASSVIQHLHHEDKDSVIQKIVDSYNSLIIWEDEYRVTIPGEKEKWVHGIASPQKLEDGSVLWYGYISDSTQRKAIELELQRVKEQYELAVNGSNDGIWDWNIITNELFLSKRWKEMLGYEVHELPNEFNTFASLLYEEDRDRVNKYVDLYLDGKIEKYSMEFRMKHKTGELKWILAKGEAIRNEDGKPVRMAGSHSDITDRKIYEEYLRSSEEKFSKTFYLNPSAAGFTEIGNDCYIDVNQAFLDLFEYEKNEVIGKNPFELGMITPEEGKRLTNVALTKMKIINEEAELYTKTGKRKTVLLSGENINLGEKIYRYTVVNDITERKMGEIALKESESHFKAVFSIVPIPIILINPRTQKVVDINEAGAKLIGMKVNEIIGKACYEFICPIEKGVCPNFDIGGKSADYEKKLITADGEERNIIKYVLPIKYKGEDCCLESIVDITDQEKKAEELEMINASLKKAKEELELSNMEKDKMYSIVAHDLKSPFQGFIGLTEVLADGAEKLPLSELKLLSKEMHTTAENLYKLVGNLLAWARVQQGKIDFNPKPVLLSLLTDVNISFIEGRARQKGIKIEKKIPDNMQVYADEEMLSTILRNLLSNAVKFSRKGGNVTVEAVETGEGAVTISVADNGIGIPQSMIGMLFTEGAKTGRTGTGGEKSTGLGLLLCREFVAMHNGLINVESKEGSGTIFTFTLQGSNIKGKTE